MVTRRRFLLLAGGAGALVVVGAGAYSALPGEEKLSGDPNIKYGQETCAQCGMVISDDRFAAALRESETSERHFDDIGCLIVYTRKHQPATGASYYITDYSGAGWLDAPSASYVVAPGIKSPMSYDIAAFGSSNAAASFAQARSAETGTWLDLEDHVKERG